MGWWTSKQRNKELVLGDAPFDTIASALAEISQDYRNDLNRKPTLAELLHTIQIVLQAGSEDYILEGAQIKISSLRAITKQGKTAQPFSRGDFFTIPLSGRKFAFARILDSSKEMGLLLGVYDVTSEKNLTPAFLDKRPFQFTPFYASSSDLKTWKWKVIGNIEIRPGDFASPRFKEGLAG